MKQQGAGRGREDDWWWRELYGDDSGAGEGTGERPGERPRGGSRGGPGTRGVHEAPGTPRTPDIRDAPGARDTADTLDERIESVLRTVGRRGGAASGEPARGESPPRKSPPADSSLPESSHPDSPSAAAVPGEDSHTAFEPRPWEPSAWEPPSWDPPARRAPSPPRPTESRPAEPRPVERPVEPRPAEPPPPLPATGVAGTADVPFDDAMDAEPVAWMTAPVTLPFPFPSSSSEADPDALGEPVPDTVLDGARFGPVDVRAVSQRGADACRRGEARGEAFLVARFGADADAVLLVAVATGLSPRGAAAQRAARAACAWAGDAVGRCATRLAQDLRAERREALRAGLQRLTARGLGRLRGRAAELGVAADADPAALGCLLVPDDPDCRTRVFFGTGAGGLFRLRHDGWEDLAPAGAAPAAHTAPDAAPAAAPAPSPACPSASFRFRAVPGRSGDVLLLCGAGVAAPLSGDPDFAARLAAAWSVPGPPDLVGFLAAVQPRGPGETKDRTAVGIWEA
ncbi:protein phosphatase 2C domain-containing protein [Streptomyces sp. cg2]|uniref:protein phosphatase 2C domain-containing protein n=1 Tax=Streptomyces sp. cg2 TaxID=3238799 RepID=UPI0034E2F3D5